MQKITGVIAAALLAGGAVFGAQAAGVAASGGTGAIGIGATVPAMPPPSISGPPPSISGPPPAISGPPPSISGPPPTANGGAPLLNQGTVAAPVQSGQPIAVTNAAQVTQLLMARGYTSVGSLRQHPNGSWSALVTVGTRQIPVVIAQDGTIIPES